MSQKGTKKKVTLGSGKLYMKEFLGSLPETFKALLAEMEKEENHAGWIKGGASIEYKPTMTTEKDDLGHIVKEVLTDEEATFKTGLFTWNGETLSKLCSTARVETKGKYRILKIGGTNNDDGKQYVVIFKHIDPKYPPLYVAIVGTNSAGLQIAFARDNTSKLEPEFTALPCDDEGSLIYVVEARVEGGG